jgi:thiamine-phosphate pyrophosphorylase
VRVALPALYPILNVRSGDESELARVKATARALACAGVTLLQLRAKELASGMFTQLASWCVAELAPLGCALIVNDRVDVALAAGAAGVHLGDEDLPVPVARALLGPGRIIGYSTHTTGEIENASAEADYLGFGPVFESPTKAGVRSARGLELLARACGASRRPVVAIGGITIDVAAELWRAGATSAAVISEIERSTDITALVGRWTASRAPYSRDRVT